jgi:hypothetical protein
MSEAEVAPSEKTYRAIGRFMFEFSQVEYAIRHYLAEEIGLKEVHFSPVVESYDVAVLCTVAKEVFAKERSDEIGARIKKGIDRFMTLNGDRKRVAHGLWVPFKDGGTVHYVSRNSLKPSWSVNQAEALEKLADELNALRAELENAFTAIPEVLFSRREKQK